MSYYLVIFIKSYLIGHLFINFKVYKFISVLYNSISMQVQLTIHDDYDDDVMMMRMVIVKMMIVMMMMVEFEICLRQGKSAAERTCSDGNS